MASSALDPRPSTAAESQRLVEEFENDLRVTAERDSSSQRAAALRKRFLRPTILVLLLAVTAYLAVSPPAWVLPRPLPPPNPQEREAGDRFAIYLQAQRIDHFRSTTGRLPATLAEAGEPMDGIDYLPGSGATYVLQSARDGALRYSSTGSFREFLGGSMKFLGSEP